LPKTVKSDAKHVLIAQRANNRIIKNDDELYWYLKSFGETKIVTLDSLSFVSQIEAMHNSKIVIAAHGAGLSHTLFASPGTIFIEIYSKGFNGYYPYKDMARILDLKWASLEANYSSWEYYSDEDIEFIKSYQTNKDDKIDSKILLSREHSRLRRLIRDPRYIKCDPLQVIDKIKSLLVAQ
jgi:capsular polysaccharide biosynthesis protein